MTWLKFRALLVKVFYTNMCPEHERVLIQCNKIMLQL